MKLQEDDKIVIAGISDQFETYQWYENIFIARYDKNGILDNSFGDNGIITTQIGKGEFDVYTYAMVLQPDNKILIAADCWNNIVDKSKALVARFLPDESVGIEKMQPAESGIIAFPNPVDDFIILENIYDVPNKLSWQLFDLTGRKMSNGLVNSDPYTIYIGNLKPSIYLLQVTDNKYKSVKNLRIIKK